MFFWLIAKVTSLVSSLTFVIEFINTKKKSYFKAATTWGLQGPAQRVFVSFSARFSCYLSC